MHIAATAPACVRREDVPADMLAKEREIYRNQALNEGKPEKVVDKIVEGRIQKFFAEVVLLEQPFAKNPDIKVADYIEQHKSKFGADLGVKQFIRWKLGEASEASAAEA
jgi:elongation factor Ts